MDETDGCAPIQTRGTELKEGRRSLQQDQFSWTAQLRITQSQKKEQNGRAEKKEAAAAAAAAAQDE